MQNLDLIITNGRVIDPERYLDDVRNVGIRDGRIVTVTRDKLSGEQSVDAHGLIVAPGFIDCHSHGQNILADRVHAFDGVTTVLELEAGILPVGRWYDIQAKNRRVLNYGTASSWVFSRFVTLEGILLSKEPRIQLLFFTAFGRSKWSSDVSTPEQLDQIVNMVEQGLKEGGLGIGVVPGYAPGTGYKELLAVQTLAANYKVPTYWHVRSEGNVDPLSAAQAYGEVISFAAATESHVHICHLNSTSFRDIGLAVRMIRSAQRQGLIITVEAYPYGAASTAIGAAALAPEHLSRAGLNYESIEYRGKRLNEESFKELRAKDPGATIVLHFYELPRDQELLDISMLFPGAIIASDSMPWLSIQTGQEMDEDTWPMPADAFAHPRSAGTFSRFLAKYVRERNIISLTDAIAKTSYLPAKLLEDSVPQMKKKGRIQAGMDADLIVFDLTTLQDRATYDLPNRMSAGMRHVLVNGV